MDFIMSCKHQICCLVVMLYMGLIYLFDGKRLEHLKGEKSCNRYFDLMIIVGDVSIVLDAVTAYTVNHLDQVPVFWNGFYHFCYYATYQLFTVFLFAYWLVVSNKMPVKKTLRALVFLPCVVSLMITAFLMPKVTYLQGNYSNYSMGSAVFVCFGILGMYLVLTVLICFQSDHYVKKNKRTSLFASMIIAIVVMSLQIAIPDLLLSSIAVVLISMSLFLNMENPSVKAVEMYHDEMLLGFSTLLDRKDGGTGEHIKRTSSYAVLIASELSKQRKYEKINKDYLIELEKAAPMHDIGKISIPDSILQKPGKLTDTEFSIMKTHSEEGAKIIAETFSHLLEDKEESMPYKVALYHHEKWDGSGYPCGISGNDIPLCARIMAVADVFDAISSKRCYRDAMPLDVCFQIIQDGRGKEFDPDVVDAFFVSKEEVIRIYQQNYADI